MSNLKLWLGICMVLFVFLTIGNAQSKVIYVPDDYNKVQQAVDAAFEGDTIIVRDGIYSENINVHEGLTIRSEKGPENCIIKSASSNDNVFDIIRNHGTGIYVPNESTRMLADSIVYLIRNTKLRLRMGKNALHLCRREFDLDVVSERFCNLYHQLVGKEDSR